MQEVGKLDQNPQTGSWRPGIGTMQRKADSTGPHFLFWHVELPPFFSILKEGPARPDLFPWRLFVPGLVLSSELCCLDLLLWSWYKYHTFSWNGYSWNGEQQRRGWPKMRKLETEIKRGGALSKPEDVHKWKRSNFTVHYCLLYTCPHVSKNETSWLSTVCIRCMYIWELWQEFRPWFEDGFHNGLQPESQPHFPKAVWGPQ